MDPRQDIERVGDVVHGAMVRVLENLAVKPAGIYCVDRIVPHVRIQVPGRYRILAQEPPDLRVAAAARLIAVGAVGVGDAANGEDFVGVVVGVVGAIQALAVAYGVVLVDVLLRVRVGHVDGLNVLMIERHAPGGQAGNSPKIENFLGFPSGISGSDLTRRAVTQARRFGAEMLTAQMATGLRSEGNTKIVTLSDGSELSAKMVLIATGAWFRTLDLPGTERWNGAGVYYGAAHTEAANCRDQDVVVLGGANAAAQGMLFLSRYARNVRVLIRGKEPTWSRYLDIAIRANDKIDLLFHTELVDIIWDEQRMREVAVKNNQTGQITSLSAQSVFVFIGQKPQSDLVGDLVLRTENGHILTGLDLVKDGKRPPGWPLNRDPLLLETSVPGIFAAGDVRNGTKHGVAAATGDGNAAVSLFWQYLSTI